MSGRKRSRRGGEDSRPETGAKRAAGAAFRGDVTLEDLRARVADFAEQRDWNQFHTPRNLVLALTGEVGELAEIFQWRGEVKPGLPGWPEADRVHLGEELSDVLLYLVRIADRCGVDLPAAALAKLEKNAEKYPADLVRGRSDKYHVYKEAARERRRAQAESVEVAEGEEGAAAR